MAAAPRLSTNFLPSPLRVESSASFDPHGLEGFLLHELDDELVEDKRYGAGIYLSGSRLEDAMFEVTMTCLVT